MRISEIRAKAREILTGKWGRAALVILLQSAILYLANLVGGFTGGLLSIAIFICTIPIEFGLAMVFMKLRRGENFEYTDFFKLGFNNFGRSWGIYGHTLLKLLPWLIVYIVSIFILIFGTVMMLVSIQFESDVVTIMGISMLGISIIALIISAIFLIVKEYLYSLSIFIAIDNPEMSTKDSVARSAELMKGRRGKFFGLELSFIGWAILTVLTFGIGTFWLTPYIYISKIVFYEDAIGKKEEPKVITE